MAVQIELSQEKEEQLRRQAAIKGLSVESFVRQIAESSLPATKDDSSQDAAIEELMLEELAHVGRDLPAPPADESYAREMIYADHE